MANSLSEAELVSLLARVALRDAGALRQLYDGTAARLFSSIARIQPERAAAEDALQETFLTVWQHAGQYRSSAGHPLAWLLTVARNKAIDSLRGNRPMRAIESDQLTTPDHPGADEPLDGDTPQASLAGWTEPDDPGEHVWHQGRTQRRLHDCIHQLPAVQRQSVVLAYMHGLTHPELAQRLRAPLGSVKSWVRRALLDLRDCLQQAKHPL